MEETLDTAFEGVKGGQDTIITEPATEPVVDSAAEKSWSARGFPESFDGMDETAVAQRVKEAVFREKQWGTQGQEIGNLRKRNKELEDSIRGALGDKPAEAIADMSVGQQTDFWKAFELNPQKAIGKSPLCGARKT